jgi:glutamate-1-semialdehyde 2,1-aminomutase
MLTAGFTMGPKAQSPSLEPAPVPYAAFIVDPQPRRTFSRPVADGCRLIDETGVARIDFDMAGGAVLLGHRHPRVEAAVAAGPPEMKEVAAVLSALLPRKPAVAFCASEGQALPAAVAVARKVTGRRRVVVWDVRSGVGPDEDDLAALLVDPLGMSPAQLRKARKAADTAGALLIFDEGTSGFRVHPRGAQGLGGVKPDLAVFGAGLANGRPIGAVAGCKALIAELDPRDLPAPRGDSLAAAHATLTVLTQLPVAQHLQVLGAELQAEVETLIKRAGAGRLFSLAGDPTLPTPLFAAPVLEGLWMREMTARQLVVVGPHALSAAHGEAEVADLVAAYAAVLPAMMARSMAEVFARPRPLYDPLFSVAPEGRA